LNKPRLVPTVRVVVAGEEIAKFVEGKFLRIAHAGGEDLEPSTIRVAPHDRAGFPFLRIFGPPLTSR
jgi:hypothetical protein